MRIVLGITSSIAAYKVPYLIRGLKKEGHEVRVVMTKNATHFVTEETLALLTENEVIVGDDYFHKTKSLHIELSKWGDVLLIAPADYNIIGKAASGIADDIVSTQIASFEGPVVFAPSMHDVMWNNPILQEKVEYLKNRGYYFSGPAQGDLLSGDRGIGRFQEIEYIIDDVYAAYRGFPLKDKKILLVYGRTEEAIDEVRVITNRSSGRMGYALAKEIKRNGGYLVQIIGKKDKESYNRDEIIHVQTTEEMKNAIHNRINDADILIMAAAVSDFKPLKREKGKIRRETTENLLIHLEKTDDILKSLREFKKDKIFVGFALSDDIENVAYEKLKEKSLDMIVANTISSMESGESSGFILTKNGRKVIFEKTPKEELASLILRGIIQLVKEENPS